MKRRRGETSAPGKPMTAGEGDVAAGGLGASAVGIQGVSAETAETLRADSLA
jgi:hypothetical protein